MNTSVMDVYLTMLSTQWPWRSIDDDRTYKMVDILGRLDQLDINLVNAGHLRLRSVK